MHLDREIGQKISAARRANGLSVAALSALLGVSCRDLSAMEAGTIRVPATLLVRISKCLRQEIFWFFDSNKNTHPALDCENQIGEARSEYSSNIMRKLRLNKTLTDLCDAARRAGIVATENNKAA